MGILYKREDDETTTCNAIVYAFSVWHTIGHFNCLSQRIFTYYMHMLILFSELKYV